MFKTSINLELYKYFFAVATYENISEAAKSLYTSQPVVSKYIQRLENELNVQLFIRKSRGVTLTEEGQILFKYVKNAMDNLNSGTKELQKKYVLGLGNIRIGVSNTLCKYLLLPYLKAYIELNPNVQITIQCQSTYHTLELLDQGKIDIGLTGEPHNLVNRNFYEVMEIEDVFVISSTLAKKYLISGTTNNRVLFDSETVMLLDKSNITRQYIDTYLSQYNISPANLLEISSMDLIIDFTKIGMGIGCVIKEFVKNDIHNGTLFQVPLETSIPKRKVGFITNNQTYMPNALRAFLDLINTDIY